MTHILTFNLALMPRLSRNITHDNLLLVRNNRLLSLSCSVKNEFLVDHGGFVLAATSFLIHHNLLGVNALVLYISVDLALVLLALLSLEDLMASAGLQLKIINQIPIDHTSFLHINLNITVTNLWIN
jgi:hypothetical protein